MYLETKRLILRTPTGADAAAYLPICNSEFVLRYNAMTTKTLSQVEKEFSTQPENTILLIQKATGRLLGAVFTGEDSLRYGVESVELSYFLAEAYTRQGYMREALDAVIAHIFTTTQAECISARSFAPNAASQRLLESLGFSCNGLIPRCVRGYGDIIYDDTLYSKFKGLQNN